MACGNTFGRFGKIDEIVVRFRAVDHPQNPPFPRDELFGFLKQQIDSAEYRFEEGEMSRAGHGETLLGLRSIHGVEDAE